MSLGILQNGPGRAVSDGVLGSTLATGPGVPYNSGVLGEYFESGTAGLGGCGCRGVGAEDGVSVPTSLILGAALGAGIMYLFGQPKKLTPNRRRHHRRRRY